MATTIKLKNSVTTTAAPSTLVQGETAVNITDKKVWVGDATSTPVQIIGAGAPVSGTTGTFTGNTTVAGTFSANGGATLGDASGDALTINSSAVSIPNGLNFDSNTFVIDATNNRVGVGTASPSYRLDVSGSSTVGSGSVIRASRTNAGPSILVEQTAASNAASINFQNTNYTGSFQIGTLATSNAGLTFYDNVNGVTRITLDASGNLGLGVTPSAWGSSFRAIQLYGGALMSNASAAGLYMPTNAYYNGTNYIYSTTAAASNYTQTAGEHKWFNAASGTAGNAITFTQAMTLNSAGYLLVGGTSSVYAAANRTAVEVNGTSQSMFANNIGGTNGGYLYHDGTNYTLNNVKNGALLFSTNNTEKMRIDSSGNLLVNTTSASGKLTVKGINNSSTDYGIYVTDSSGNLILGTRNDGYIRSPSTYAATSASAANITIDSSGYMYRSTSALKYKQDIRDLESIDINKFRPVRYKSKCESDDQTKDHFGIIADEVDTVGITELVNYGADGEVEGFQYERLTVVLLKELQTLRAEVDSLKAQLNK